MARSLLKMLRQVVTQDLVSKNLNIQKGRLKKSTLVLFDKEKSFQCKECEGFDHHQSECPNFLKRQNKSYVITLSDEESDDGCEPEDNFKALVSCISSYSSDEKLHEYKFLVSSGDDETSDSSIATMYRDLYKLRCEEAKAWILKRLELNL